MGTESASTSSDAWHSGGGGGGGCESMGVDERLVETLVAYKDAIDSRSLLPISFV